MPKSLTTLMSLSPEITDRLSSINSGASQEDLDALLLDKNISNEAYQLYKEGSNRKSGRYPYAQGVYAGWPATTPKYMRHRQGRNRESLETMARMYVKVRTGNKTGGEARQYMQRLVDTFAEAGTQEVASVLLGNGGSVGGLGYVDFFLQRVDHPLNEKFQIVETLSDNYVAFFFGQQAPVFNYSGVVMNTFQDDWAMRLFRMFRDITRGSQLARRGLLFYIKYDSMIVSGAMLNLNFTVNAAMEIAVPFSFQLLVKKVHIVQGGLTTPTEVPDGSTFIPEGFQLVETDYSHLAPKLSKPSGDDMTGGTVQTPTGTDNTEQFSDPVTSIDDDPIEQWNADPNSVAITQSVPDEDQ